MITNSNLVVSTINGKINKTNGAAKPWQRLSARRPRPSPKSKAGVPRNTSVAPIPSTKIIYGTNINPKPSRFAAPTSVKKTPPRLQISTVTRPKRKPKRKPLVLLPNNQVMMVILVSPHGWLGK